jgi:hypothetical protein
MDPNTLLICRTACFLAGAALEVYTYNLNPDHSFGLGWGLLAALLLPSRQGLQS